MLQKNFRHRRRLNSIVPIRILVHTFTITFLDTYIIWHISNSIGINSKA